MHGYGCMYGKPNGILLSGTTASAMTGLRVPKCMGKSYMRLRGRHYIAKRQGKLVTRPERRMHTVWMYAWVGIYSKGLNDMP